MKAPDAKFPKSDDSRQTADMAWRSVSTLAAGMLLYGGLGWLVGRWLGHQAAFMAAGLLLGMALALYITYARVSAMSQSTTTSDRRNP